MFICLGHLAWKWSKLENMIRLAFTETSLVNLLFVNASANANWWYFCSKILIWGFANSCVSLSIYRCSPCMINPNDNLPLSMTLIPLVQSAISVAKPWCDCEDLSFGKKIIRGDYCVVTHSKGWDILTAFTSSLQSMRHAPFVGSFLK